MSKTTIFILLLNAVAFYGVHGDWEIINAVSNGYSHITASSNYLWSVNSAHQIHMCARPCKGSWVKIPGALKQIDASDHEVWGVSKANQIFKRPVDGSGKWIRVSGSLKHVSASGNGYIWGVNSGDKIFKCKKPCSGRWKGVNGRLKQIDGGYAYVYGINSAGKVFSRPIDGSNNWRHIRSVTMRHITGSGKNDIFATTSKGEVFRCNKPCIGEWEKMPTNYKKIAQCDASYDAVFGASHLGSIYRHKTGK